MTNDHKFVYRQIFLPEKKFLSPHLTLIQCAYEIKYFFQFHETCPGSKNRAKSWEIHKNLNKNIFFKFMNHYHQLRQSS